MDFLDFMAKYPDLRPLEVWVLFQMRHYVETDDDLVVYYERMIRNRLRI